MASTTQEKEILTVTDVVVHRHLAGPVMSVVAIEREENADIVAQSRRIIGIRACWFTPIGEYCTALFHTQTLRRAQPEERQTGYTSAAKLAI